MKISNEQIDKLLDELLELHPKRIDLSLDRVCNLLEKLDNPQNKINNIVEGIKRVVKKKEKVFWVLPRIGNEEETESEATAEEE